ncbi:hypothetical protein EC973_009042 [Apophysomyces ossiformis]|uniref:Phenylalanine--tRNA ligase, mitochondrial n=1 Tax=Apophysomyces ossiformis TaxID=679940 RepID=A0A8H7BSL0_9FUNG|nr:hypothetical protein EC973_009042 [Apophysomyces ossiformis]
MDRQLHLQPTNPISIIRQLIESHFSNFRAFNDLNPVVSTEKNFDDLLIPANHPSRTKSDNYYINKDTVLRAHTSAHQLDGLRSGADKFLISGDVYRRDEIDSSHYPVFHQIEGLAYFDQRHAASLIQAELDSYKAKGENIRLVDDTVITDSNPIQDCHSPEDVRLVAAHLKHSINSMIRSLFVDEPNLEVRWIDAYFPFTSPSWEVEILYKGEWLEVLGSGVVRQELLNNAGHHDKIGWAFGMGLERLAMVLFGIPDIRLFWSQDSRFIEQFTPGKIQKFVPFSKYPPCIKDISFWLPEDEWHENNFCELIRGVAGDIVENVKLKLAAEEIRQAEEARLHSKYIDLQLNQHKRSSQQLSLGETTTHERLDGPSSTSVLSTEDDWFSCSTGNNLPVILSPFVPPSRPEYAASNSPSIASGITTSPYMSFDTPFADLSLSTASSPEPNMAETSSAAQQRSEASSSSQTKKTSKRSFSFPGDPSRMQHQTKKSDTFSSTDTDEPLDHGKVMEALRAKLRRSSSPYHKGTQDQSTNTTSRTGVLLLNLKTRKKASAGRRGR